MAPAVRTLLSAAPQCAEVGTGQLWDRNPHSALDEELGSISAWCFFRTALNGTFLKMCGFSITLGRTYHSIGPAKELQQHLEFCLTLPGTCCHSLSSQIGSSYLFANGQQTVTTCPWYWMLNPLWVAQSIAFSHCKLLCLGFTEENLCQHGLTT